MSKEGQMILVDIEKFTQGMRQVFTGCAAVFDALDNGSGVEIKEALRQVKQEYSKKADDKEKSEPVKEKAKKAETIVTVDDIIKIATAKISANRQNSEKINQLLKSYGASRMSELPTEKYEAFLTDLSQL